ncbi:DUF2975 domain-containing protein [Lacicoccus alkaliphilus]|uniref:DUF2975 domain-containing protein n=1 Tax=Lacicoccus alkaliphilus DSM 16010 TaxID=1123231 RepID=A0A1M7EJ67_9BACL|nr:DUF2975 domain-containing protein [Salinicoccus alkaliphilus]SHL91754.1 Protein of unknown function [Salinicoccus alkaliphilus DSM 16010]
MTNNAVVHKRFKTMVKILYVLSYIPLALLALGLFATLAGIIAVPFIPLDRIESGLTQLPITGTYETTGLTLEVTEAYLETINLDQTAILLWLSAQFLYITAITLIFFFINRWLHNLTNGHIFTLRNSRLIELAAYTLMIFTLIDALTNMALQNLLLQTFSLAEIASELNEQSIVGFNRINIDFNLMILFSGIIIWILAKVFKYGAFLQDEYDATV